MDEYVYTKIIAVIVGILTIVGAIGFGFLAFIGIGLSNALDHGHNNSSMDSYILVIPVVLILVGLFTAIGSFYLRHKAWKTFYMVCCLLLGIGLIVGFFISFGAIGTKNEIFVLCVGVIYMLLGYLVKRKK